MIRILSSLLLLLGIATVFVEIVMLLGWISASSTSNSTDPKVLQQTGDLLQSMTGLLEQLHQLMQTSAGSAFVVTALVSSYFVPALAAMARGRANTGGILVFNLFLGWTFLGWVIALVWACTGSTVHHHIPHRLGT